jgi:hypothetical protein
VNSDELDIRDPEVTKSAKLFFPNKYFNVFLLTSNPDAKKKCCRYESSNINKGSKMSYIPMVLSLRIFCSLTGLCTLNMLHVLNISNCVKLM